MVTMDKQWCNFNILRLSTTHNGYKTSKYVSNGLITIMSGWYSHNIEGASLFVHGYHSLPLATIDLVGDNREFEVWGIYLGLIPIMSGW